MWGGNALMLPVGAPRLHTSRLHCGRPLRLTYRRNAGSFSSRRHSMRTTAELRTKGQRYQAEQLSLRQSLGEGSFGEVFEGVLKSAKGEQRVIMKRVKDKVEGAAQMHEMEHLLTVYASKAARNSVADFLGFCEVEVQEPRSRLTKGLWLVWAYQGNKTLAYYLKRRDCMDALARDMCVAEEVVVPTVMRHIFQCLEDIHAAGLVHRDIKPANIIFCERDRRFKLIDLGAACDLRSGINYSPTETILDPCYCPPEEYVLPTDAPHLSRQAAPLALAMSPLLWNQHRPDCFDTYSAGIILMQLAIPSLRTVTALRTFRQSLARNEHSIQEWRTKAILPSKQTEILDAHDGEGWDLAEGLLRAREIETDGDNVKFVNKGGPPRLTAGGALRHPFVKKAANPAPTGAGAGVSGGAFSPLASLFVSITGGSTAAPEVQEEDLAPAAATSSSGGGGLLGGWGRSSGSGGRDSGEVAGKQQQQASAKGSDKLAKAGAKGKPAAEPAVAAAAPPRQSLWQRLASQLYDLEARVNAETTATERQTTLVQQLRAEVQAGRAKEEELQREEGALTVMQYALQDSIKDLRGIYGAAAKFLGSSPKQPAEAAPAPQRAQQSEVPAPTAAQRQQAAAAAQQAMETVARAEEVPATSLAAAEEKAGQSSGWGQTASNMVYAGLKFTGLAVHVATSLATAVKSDAEKALKEAQEEAATLRQATSAYVEALQQLQPPVGVSTSYDSVAPRIPAAEAYASLPEARRRQAFVAYVDGLRRAERTARQRAMADFVELLAEVDLPPSTPYSAFAKLHSDDLRFLAVGEVEVREAAYAAHMEGLRSRQDAVDRAAEREAEERERVLRAETGFRVLLAGQEAAIKAGASWVQVKRNMWADPRFDALLEQRRRELFAEYCELLAEAGEMAGAGAVASGAGVEGPPGEDGAQLDQLRQEQAKLKEEYDRLEAKLKEMEQQFKQTLPMVAGAEEEPALRVSPVNGVPVNGMGRK